MSIQAAANFLEAPNGGAGLLIGGVPGVPPAKVVIIGGGVVGQHAAEMAIGLGGNVTILDRNNAVLDECEARWGASVTTVYSTGHDLERLVIDADVVVGAVLVKGDKAPKLVTAEMISAMRPARLWSTSRSIRVVPSRPRMPRPTPTRSIVVDGVVHYAVANMPGAVPKPRPTRSTTQRCRSLWHWPTWARRRQCWPIHICATDST